MNHFLRQLLIATNRVIAQLRQMVAQLEIIKNENKAAHAREAETYERDQRSNICVSPTPVEIKSFPPLPHGEETYQKDKRTRERIHFHVGWATLVILAFYTVIAAYQSCLTRQAITDSEESFRKTLYQMKAQTAAQQAAAKSQECSAVAAGKAAKAMADQVTKMQAGVDQTSRLAKAAEDANRNAIAAERPWIGGSITVQNFEPNKTPTYTIIFINSGKRPAKVTLAAGENHPYFTFPENPEYTYDTTNVSASIVVPGQPLVNTWDGKIPLSGEETTAYKSNNPTFYVYGKVDYTDPERGGIYWTHICAKYAPGISTTINFIGCGIYNDAK